MPLFVFVVLGLLQLGLMNQARVLTKYAAYKAVRAGALSSAKHEVMEQAALAVLVPMVSRHRPAAQGGELQMMYRVDNAAQYSSVMASLGDNQMPEAGLKFVDVTVCNPTLALTRDGTVKVNGRDEYDFDDPRNATGTQWRRFMRTKLVAQVTFNYRMTIPFANILLYFIATGQERADQLWLNRLGTRPSAPKPHDAQYDALAAQRVYVLPIRAHYQMRMQSNLFPSTSGFELPTSNECVVPFAKQTEGDSGGSSGGPDVNPDEGGDPGDPT